MEDKEKLIIDKISYAIEHRHDLSQKELKDIYEEALNFGNTLSLDDRGEFFWTSGIECLSMLV